MPSKPANNPSILTVQMCIHWVHSCFMKDVGFRIRVQRDLREAFLEVCRAQDKPAAQVLREFMRAYVEKSKISQDQTLLVESADEAEEKTKRKSAGGGELKRKEIVKSG